MDQVDEVCAKETQVHMVKLATRSVSMSAGLFCSLIQSEAVFFGGLNAPPSLLSGNHCKWVVFLLVPVSYEVSPL